MRAANVGLVPPAACLLLEVVAGRCSLCPTQLALSGSKPGHGLCQLRLCKHTMELVLLLVHLLLAFHASFTPHVHHHAPRHGPTITVLSLSSAAAAQAPTTAQISVADSVACYDVQLLTGSQADQVCSREQTSRPELPAPLGTTQ